MNRDSNNVSAYAIDPNTGSHSDKRIAFPRRIGTTGRCTRPEGKFFYVTNGNSNNASAYIINLNTGVLTAINGWLFAPGSGPYGVTIATVT